MKITKLTNMTPMDSYVNKRGKHK